MTECMGVPVRYDRSFNGISDSRGIFRWKEIVVGQAFFACLPREQAAILVHEVGHCRLRHLEKRLAKTWLLAWRPALLAEYCRRQELEADRFCQSQGYGQDLAQLLERLGGGMSPLHPSSLERAARLRSIV